MTDQVRISLEGHVLSIVINRPEKRNALNDAMAAAMADALEAAETDRDVRAILFHAEGEMFTAGNDLSDFAKARPGDAPLNISRFIGAIEAATKPLVAAVQGRAVGVGTTMLLHFDHVVLAEGAKLTAPFVSLGLVPEGASSLLLPLRIGHARAFSVLAMGQPIEAEEALSWGLANAVVPADQLLPTAMDFARRVARQPIGAVIATKQLMRDTDRILEHAAREATLFYQRLQSAEAKEAFSAFAEKRKPDFTRI